MSPYCVVNEQHKRKVRVYYCLCNNHTQDSLRVKLGDLFKLDINHERKSTNLTKKNEKLFHSSQKRTVFLVINTYPKQY
jgi:hypothetical protein